MCAQERLDFPDPQKDLTKKSTRTIWKTISGLYRGTMDLYSLGPPGRGPCCRWGSSGQTSAGHSWPSAAARRSSWDSPRTPGCSNEGWSGTSWNRTFL